MRQDLAAFQAEGEAGLQPLFLALMAEMYERMGQVTAGLSTLDAALALARKPGSRYYEAEPVSAKGELLLARAVEHHAEVEACFHQALDVAHRQQAKSWELRAAMRLSWLWQGQGKRAEAYQLLAEVYSRFTEGFDTADLREAKAPLDDLA